MVVTGVVTPAVGPMMRRRRADGRDFGVRAEASATNGATVSATAGVTVASLLALQEAESERQQDREARQHGDSVMAELTALQRALLSEDGPDVERLAVLLARPVNARDPALAGLLRAIRLRAGIELARWKGAASM